jgi:agmatinase
VEEEGGYPGFMGVGPEWTAYERARVAILPVPFEATTTYVKGTRRGPEAIINASHNVELYDEELGRETYKDGIATLPPVAVADLPFDQAAERIAAAARQVLADGKLLVSLGGEHSITPPLVDACASVAGRLTVLQLDAHSDLRDSYGGTPNSHACAMRRVTERHPAVQVGIRSLCVEEAELLRGGGHHVFFAHQMIGDSGWMDHALALLGEKVYLTIDLDYFDPSLIPAVGTPEPGGPGWYETLRFLRRVATERRIVAMDVVELCPIEGQVVSDFTAARLIYRLIGYSSIPPAGSNPRGRVG